MSPLPTKPIVAPREDGSIDIFIGADYHRLPPACCECARYVPDSINPAGGLGNCAAGHGYRYPGQCPPCPDFEASP